MNIILKILKKPLDKQEVLCYNTSEIRKRGIKKMTKEQIKAMMNNTNQTLVAESTFTLEYENPCYGETITFEFGENGLLESVYS